MRRGFIAGLTLLALAPAAPAVAAVDDSTLSTRLQELASPDLRDASRADQADAISLLPDGAGSLARAHGALLVEIRVAGNESAHADRLSALGAEILHLSHEYDTITAAVDESDLRAVAGAHGVEYVGEVITPMTGSVEEEGATGAINTCAPGVISEGNTQLRANVAKTQFDVDGTGVKVGILSDSYDTKPTASTHAANDVASADLPGAGNPCGRTEPVQVVDDSAVCNPPPCGDEGRAMLQIVHDIAPGASLAFATAFGGQTSFADNIRALAGNGADIIADDVIYFTEPMYQDGIIAKAVNDVTAQGVAYFSMAFNSNGLGVNSYEAPNGYRSEVGGCPAPVIADRAGGVGNSCMDFDPGGGVDTRFDVNLDGTETLRLSLSWAEPMFGVANDFDVYLINPAAGDAVILAGKSNNLTSQTPTDFGSATTGAAGNYQIVIRRYAGSGSPRIKFVSDDNGAETINSTQAVAAPDIQGPTIFGHNGANASVTVGAVPFNNSNVMETFSGRGPVTSIFAPVNGTTASPALGSPLTLVKPDVSATDKGITTFFGSGNRFSGTSAAAPHAAAVGALQLAANPILSRNQIEAGQKATARPVGAFGPNDMGAGLIDAQAAIAAQPPGAPTVNFSSGPTAPVAVRNPTFAFTTTKAKTTFCSVDGGVAQDCSSGSYTTPILGDGLHTAAVTATDFFGQSTTATRSFAVDATGPAAPTFGKTPKKKTKSRRATFAFSSEPGATFLCSLDGKAFTPCSSPTKVKVKKAKPKPKKHSFAVQPIDALGNAGVTATYRWKVVRKKRRR